MEFKFKIGDTVRLLTPQELEAEKGLYVDDENDILIADSAHPKGWSDDLVTMFESEFKDNQGKVFKIKHQSEEYSGFPTYEIVEVGNNDNELREISELALVAVCESSVNNKTMVPDFASLWDNIEGLQTAHISVEGITVTNPDTALEQARKIMEHAVSMVNSLGVKIGFVDYEVDGEEQSFISLENKYGIYISKDEFGQGGKFDE